MLAYPLIVSGFTKQSQVQMGLLRHHRCCFPDLALPFAQAAPAMNDINVHLLNSTPNQPARLGLPPQSTKGRFMPAYFLPARPVRLW